MLRLLPVLVAMSLLVGCGTLARPSTPDVKRLHLDGDAARIDAVPSVADALLVTIPRSLPGFATPRFAYMQRNRELSYYARHEWAADPSRMLQPAVVRALEQSGRFSAVVASPSAAIADLRLDLEVVELLHDYRDRNEVRFAVRAQLLRLGDRRVIATRLFEVRERADTGPIEGAAAADRAMARILELLVGFCIEHTGG